MTRLFALKGHRTRYEEIKCWLAWLGGRTEIKGFIPDRPDEIYFVDSGGIIRFMDAGHSLAQYHKALTLEEFESEFPYKVGQFVRYRYETEMPFGVLLITGVQWDNDRGELKYGCTDAEGHINVFSAEELEDQVSDCEIEQYKKQRTLAERPVIDLSVKKEDEYVLNLGDYELQERDGEVVAIRKKKFYPTTLEECFDILGSEDHIYTSGPCRFEVEAFHRLLVCREAYWKLADNWSPGKETKLSCMYYNRMTERMERETADDVEANFFLMFPNDEMLDAFVVNFDRDIDMCKELL